MKFIRKLFIKNYEDTKNPAVRYKHGLVAGIFGIISNVILCVFKLIVGIIGNSITVIADAINNLSDAGSSAVTVFGFKLSSLPADSEHPFGHARYEYISGLVVSVIILVIGVLLMKSSIEKCITPEEVSCSVFTYIVLGAAILMKLFQMMLYLNFSKAIDSGALKASAMDSRNDIIATTAVLISTIIIDTTGVNIDAYMGIAVSLFIIVSAVMLIKESMSPILGEKPDKELVEKLTDKIKSYDGVLGIHDLVIHSYGQTKCFALCHVEVDASVNILISHDIIDNIEHDVFNELGIILNIHLDPVDLQDEEMLTLKKIAESVLEKEAPALSLHDFRIVKGDTHTNILFDIVLPFGDKTDIKEVENKMEEEFRKINDTTYFFVVDVDRQLS
ncbi:MAG: cation diffusion facilitator family transporter [Clostridia bacterium]|nr:cation diffusion facilitator family transporter [Clostridia bacterium]